MKTAIVKFLRDEEGATAIEYGLIAGLIALALVAAITALQGDISALFTRIGTALDGVAVTTGSGT